MKDKKGREIVEFVECPECEMKFTRKAGLSIHLKNKHKYNKEDILYHKELIKNIITVVMINLFKQAKEKMQNTIDDKGRNVWEANAQKEASRRRSIINKDGLNLLEVIAARSAQTKRELSNEDGLNIHQQTGLKIKASHLKNVNSNGENGYQQLAAKTVKTKNNKIDENGLNEFQRMRHRQNDVLRNEIDENGLNGLNREALKGAKTKLEKDPDCFKHMGRKAVRACIERNGRVMCPNLGLNETLILNEIEQEKNIKLTRQYYVKGFWVDGYDEENNVVYEVNERYHYANEKQIEKDKYRQKIITEELNCKFIIIDDLH
jgi:uncharacterized C2H2 Zn-finger protein